MTPAVVRVVSLSAQTSRKRRCSKRFEVQNVNKETTNAENLTFGSRCSQSAAQPGRVYEFDVPQPDGTTNIVRIREDSDGDYYGPDDPQNRGPHFNTDPNNHYDY
jgi:hypothetical protein